MGTILVHALIFLPFVLELSLPPRQLPNRSGAGASAIPSTHEPVMTVVFINEVSQAPQLPTIKPEELASRGIAPEDLAVLVFSPDSAPASQADPKSEDTPDAPQAIGDPTEHALLYGRYIGQIQARIDRAWLRPRSEIGAPRFNCRARIEQDRSGAVINVKLDHCNGSPRWQQSLVSAIRTASPLPAPPDPSVYADALSLVFISAGFQRDLSTDGFEPPGLSTQLPAPELQEPGGLAERAGFRHTPNTPGDGVVHLTIVGHSQTNSGATVAQQ
jgi:TonB C terminal